MTEPGVAIVTAEIVRLMRDASGMGMMDCKAAAETAVADLGGDFVTALLARHANGFAVSVKSKDPDVSDAEARRRWNLAWAMGSRADYAVRDEWRNLDELSTRYEGPVVL